MSKVENGCCIIDAMSGIDTASPQINCFTDNFNSIKFLLSGIFSDYTIMIITDINGHVEIVNTDGSRLTKSTNSSTNTTTLTWKPGKEITSASGVVVYQIAAYKPNGDSIESVWYSKEGRLVVSESIDTTSYSAEVLGTGPNLLTRLLLEMTQVKESVENLDLTKVDKVDGKELSDENYSLEEKEKLSGIEAGAEINIQSDWEEIDETSDSYIKNKPVIDINYDPESENAQSGKAVAEALWDKVDVSDLPITDQIYNSKSQNAQSGKAVAEAISVAFSDLPLFVVDASKENIDHIYIPGIYYLKNMEHSSYPYGLENVLIVTGTVYLYKQTLFSPGEPIKERFCTDADWSEWEEIVDNSMLESRLKRFADEFTVDVDQSYNANSENAQSGKAVAEAVAKIVNGSPEALDTLYELAKALGNDENFSATVMKEIGRKADYGWVSQTFDTLDVSLQTGKLIVGRAAKDSEGNRIDSTYATKEELNETNVTIGNYKDLLIELREMSESQNIVAALNYIYELHTSDLNTATLQAERYTNDMHNIAIKYVDSQIGDIETSLENIIAKYGLGGETV